MSPLRLGTRGSQLALWQARAVAAEIQRHGGPSCEVIAIKTTGDHSTHAPLAEVGGKRLFVKEIEDALLQRDIDLAVHSAKDLPAVLPPGLVLASVLPRDDPRDGLVLAQQAGLGPAVDPTDLAASLGLSPRVGTSSVRRVAQLTRLFQTPGSRQSEATSIRGCASSTPGSTMYWSWRWPAYADSASLIVSRRRCR